VGAYRIEEKLGGGGFGNVYRATHVDLGINRAIKIMQSALGAQAEFRERFLHEAKMAARLEHPNIVPVLDYGLEQDTQFIVMAFVPSETLEHRIASRQPVPFDTGLRIATQIASALEYAHRLGLVHRDIKPANILLRDPGGDALLTDFGIARVAGERGLTQTGMAVGTFAYMSPEQCKGVIHELDGRSDLYSFAVVLFEVLTGKLPFGDGPAAVAGHLTQPAPSARSLNPYLPEDVDRVLGHALAKEARDRYPDAHQLIQAFVNAFGSSSAAAAPVAPALPGAPEPAPAPTPAAGGDPSSAAQRLEELGREAARQGRDNEVRIHWEGALRTWRELDRVDRVAALLVELGRLVARQGRYVEALPYLEESLGLWRGLGEKSREAACLLDLAWLATAAGNTTAAREHCRQSFDVYGSLADKVGSTRALYQLGLALDQERNRAVALRVFARAALLALEAGDRVWLARARSQLGRLALELEQQNAARRVWIDTIRLSEEIGELGEVAPLLFKLTTIALRRGEQEVAVRLGATAARLFQAQGDLRQSQAVEAAVAPAVKALPEKVAWEAWTEGWAMSPAEAAGRAATSRGQPVAVGAST